jgi:hypothetical protein
MIEGVQHTTTMLKVSVLIGEATAPDDDLDYLPMTPKAAAPAVDPVQLRLLQEARAIADRADLFRAVERLRAELAVGRPAPRRRRGRPRRRP